MMDMEVVVEVWFTKMVCVYVRACVRAGEREAGHVL